MKRTVLQLQEDQRKSQHMIEDIKMKCENLEQENATLKQKVDTVSLQLNQTVLEDRRSLLIGDSLIRDVDEEKLVKAQVTSIPGGKAADVLKRLQSCDGSYRDIFCCVGTNNGSMDEFNDEDVITSFQNIKTAKAKVNDPKNVCLVSIPPRTDSEEYQQHVHITNACLSTVARDEGVTFINNDTTFKLSDGTPNDGYLLSDGLHLNNRGTNRLVKNMKLKISDNAPNGNVVKHGRQKNNTKITEVENNARHEVSNKRSLRRNRQAKPDIRKSEPHDDRRSERHCWYCGEANHVSNKCRHGEKISCHNCQKLRQKAKCCPQ